MAVDVGTFEHVQNFMWVAKEKGLITDWFLFNDHSFRICPPLSIRIKEVKEASQLLVEIAEEVVAGTQKE